MEQMFQLDYHSYIINEIIGRFNRRWIKPTLGKYMEIEVDTDEVNTPKTVQRF